jgi:hypothetical protein
MAQMTPAQLRAQAEAALEPLGQRRIRLLADLESLDSELRPLIVAARQAEVPLRRITALTAVAGGTIRAWESKARENGPEGLDDGPASRAHA